jgi:hypothetical protein
VIRRLSGLAIGLALGLGVAGGAQAAVEHDEVGNATRFFNNGVVAPQDVGPGIDVIHGTISGADQGDLYRLEFDVGGALVIRGRGTTGPLIPTLFLFDASGAGLLADAGGVLDARIDVTIAPGIYYIGIGDVPLQAVDTDGTIWPAPGTAGAPPADFGTLDFLDHTGTAGVSSGNYRIFLSMPTAGTPLAVPAPATAGLLGLALAGLAAIRRRNPRPLAGEGAERSEAGEGDGAVSAVTASAT